jgi:hypothetical protein
MVASEYRRQSRKACLPRAQKKKKKKKIVEVKDETCGIGHRALDVKSSRDTLEVVRPKVVHEICQDDQQQTIARVPYPDLREVRRGVLSLAQCQAPVESMAPEAHCRSEGALVIESMAWRRLL